MKKSVKSLSLIILSISFLLIMIGAISAVCILNSAPDPYGSAYQITTCDDLQQVRNCPNNANYVLKDDIYCEGEDFNPLFVGDSFTGKFNGNGHFISDLYIDYGGENSGLFSYIGENGIVENLVLEKIYATGQSNTGGLAGYNTGTIINCHILNIDFDVEGKTTENGIIATSWNNVGGLAGVNEGTIIDSSISGGIVKGNQNVGGLVGYNKIPDEIVSRNDLDDALLPGSSVYIQYNSIGSEYFLGHVVNSYSSTKIEGVSSVGGLVGKNDRHIHNSFSSGANPANLYSLSYIKLISGNQVGGLVGENIGQIYDSYSFSKTISGTNNGGLVGKNEVGRIYNSFEKSATLSGTCSGNLVGFFGCSFGVITDSKNFDISHGCINPSSECRSNNPECESDFDEQYCSNNQILSTTAYGGFFGGWLNVNDPDGIVWKRYDVVDSSVPILLWMGCGDAILNSAYEECDDGNIANGDGCDSQCKTESQNELITAPINGQCNPHLNSVTFADRTVLDNAIMIYFGLCREGTSTGLSGNGPWNWICEGKNGGNIATCSAYKTGGNTENCGIKNGLKLDSLTLQSPGLCIEGVTASNFQTTSSGWTWKCGSSTCSAINNNIQGCSSDNQCWIENSHCITTGTNKCTCESGYTPDGNGRCVLITYTCVSPNSCKSSCGTNEEQKTGLTCATGICCGSREVICGDQVCDSSTETWMTCPEDCPTPCEEYTTQSTCEGDTIYKKDLGYTPENPILDNGICSKKKGEECTWLINKCGLISTEDPDKINDPEDCSGIESCKFLANYEGNCNSGNFITISYTPLEGCIESKDDIKVSCAAKLPFFTWLNILLIIGALIIFYVIYNLVGKKKGKSKKR